MSLMSLNSGDIFHPSQLAGCRTNRKEDYTCSPSLSLSLRLGECKVRRDNSCQQGVLLQIGRPASHVLPIDCRT